MRSMLVIVLSLLLCLTGYAAEPRVMIISIDGLRPDCALRADMPNLRSLLKNGSFTFWATTTTVAVTLPSHTSMVTGVVVETHGIKGNDDKSAATERILVPTIFDLARQAGISTGMAAGKSKFTMYADSMDHSWVTKKSVTLDSDVGNQALAMLLQHKPRLMFLHFPGADSSGHSMGWGSAEQIAVIEGIDIQLGRVLRTLDEIKLRDETTIIISADHGGAGKTHGGETASMPSNQSIPWIISGPGIRKNVDLSRVKGLAVRTYDTFATACNVLGLTVPSGIDGKPILEAFEGTELIFSATTVPATQATSATTKPQSPTPAP